MEIHELRQEDLPALAALYRQFWGEASDTQKMCAQYEKIRKAGTHILLGAYEDGRLAGSAMGVVCEELYGDCRPFLVLENMIVDSSCRKKGAGRALLAEMERLARLRGCTQIILVTEYGRDDACAFYAATGFCPDTHRGFKKKL